MRTHQIAFSTIIACLSLSGFALVGSGCAGTRYERSTGAYVDDKALTAKVKTALFKDSEVSGFDVNVNTFRGEVQLSGFVDTPQQKERAAAVAREIPGVQMVVNNLEIKPGPAPSTAVGSFGAAVQGRSGTVTGPVPLETRDHNRPLTPGVREDQLPVRESDPNLNRNLDRTDIDRAPQIGSERNQSTTGSDITRTAPAAIAPAGRIDQRTAPFNSSTTIPDQPGARDLRIDLEHGKATIRGNVATENDRNEIARRVRDIPGVESVDNQLEVRPAAPVRE